MSEEIAKGADRFEERVIERDGGHSFGFWLWLFFCLVVLYVLSIGPVVKILRKTGANGFPPALVVLYKPLEVLYHGSPVAKGFFDWYIHDVWKAN